MRMKQQQNGKCKPVKAKHLKSGKMGSIKLIAEHALLVGNDACGAFTVSYTCCIVQLTDMVVTTGVIISAKKTIGIHGTSFSIKRPSRAVKTKYPPRS